jgi:hypothetical protein
MAGLDAWAKAIRVRTAPRKSTYTSATTDMESAQLTRSKALASWAASSPDPDHPTLQCGKRLPENAYRANVHV